MKDLEKCKNKKTFVIGGRELDIPVIQGGMGVGVSLSGLAGAVAKEGGVGIISTAQIGFNEPDFDTDTLGSCLGSIRSHIIKAKEIAQNKGMVGVNVMTALKNYREHVEEAVKSGADIIVCGAGLPVDLPSIVSDACRKFQVKKPFIAPIVSSARAAKILLKHWADRYGETADLIVVEGPKAGGHLGYAADEAACPDSVDFDNIVKSVIDCKKEYEEKFSKRIAVAAGGGISAREDAEHVFSLGADAIQVASRFVATKECDADERYKQAYVDADKDDIVIIKSPVGMPGRAVRNAFVRSIEQKSIPVKKCLSCLSKCNPAQIPYCITDALIKAVKGDVDNGLIFCGAEIGEIKKISSVKNVIEELLYI